MKYRRILEILALVASANAALGSVVDSRTIEIDLTDTNAASQCEWVPAERYAITRKGLGWESAPGAQQANGGEIPARWGEILTHPVGVGYWYRTTPSVGVRTELSPGPQQLTNNSDGKRYYDPPGHMYARHSPDRQHWSSWQALTLVSPTNRVYEGELAIPQRERGPYEQLLFEYTRHDGVRWPNDEEAAVRWILSRNPDFFATHLPFIGYVQLLFEGDFVSGRRFRTFKAVLSFSVGGLGLDLDDEHIKQNGGEFMPWRFPSAAPLTRKGVPGR